jgi:hypothetical protein
MGWGRKDLRLTKTLSWIQAVKGLDFTPPQGFISAHLDVEEQRGFTLNRRTFSSEHFSEVLWDDRGFYRGRHKRKRKGPSSKGKVGNLLLGREVGMNNVVQMVNQTLVGRASGRFFAHKTIVSWAESAWKEDLGYTPEVIELSRNWFAFKFNRSEDTNWVLGRNWSINSSPLLLKPWSPLFDATKERMDKIHCLGPFASPSSTVLGHWIISKLLEIFWGSFWKQTFPLKKLNKGKL